jgi:signal peptidase II
MTQRPKPNALIWLLLSAAIIGLDQWTKEWVLRTLPEYTAVPVIDGFWNWYRSYNTGAAFSFLADAGGWQKYLFTALAIGICSMLTFWLSRTARSDWRSALPFSLVIGGALGNIIDRMQHGHVIDFIQWHWRDFYWPSFNVADSAIVAGAVGLILFGVVFDGRGKAQGKAGDAPPAGDA